MAHEVVKRISVLVHQSYEDQVVDTLQKIGTVHVDRIESEDSTSLRALTEEETRANRHYSFRISQVEFILDLLGQYKREGRGFLKSMIKDKYPMTVEEFLAAEERVDLDSIYEDCTEIEQRLIALRERNARLEQEALELSGWKELEMPLEAVTGGATFEVLPLRVDVKSLEELGEDLASDAPESYLDVVSDDGRTAHCLAIFHRDLRDEVMSVLSRYKIDQPALPGVDVEPTERLKQIDQERAGVETDREELIDRLEEHRASEADLLIAREFYRNQINKLEAKACLGETCDVTVIDGWVTESGIEKTRKRLSKVCDEVEVEIYEPGEDDNPPVSLTNRRATRPFELLTGLYGAPNNREYDPTWLIAISFTIFFGFCIGDVGYGLVIVVGFWLMRRYLPLGENVKKLMLVLVYGGFLAILVGLITGSWFGYSGSLSGFEPEKLPQFIKALAVFDPLQDPIPLMGVCMGLGILHMLAGTAVEFRDNWKQGHKANAMIDQGLVIYLFVGTAIMAVLYIIEIIPMIVLVIVPVSALVGMVTLMGHNAKSLPGKIFGGLYETYNTMVGWLGDTVSYVRLFALGLATFAVGMVINILAGMAMGMLPVVGILLMIIILLVGHLFNTAINLLGAFVHPLRLEYVEFFSKFYEDGGRKFKPLEIESNIVLIEEQGP